MAGLPDVVDPGSHFGPDLLCFILHQYHHQHVDEVALACFAQQKLAQTLIDALTAGPRCFADDIAWQAHLSRLSITTERHVRIATEGSLPGSLMSHGVSPQLAVTHCAFRNPRVWDIANKKQILQNNEYWASALAISRNGKLGVMGMSNGDVVLFDVETGKDYRTMHGHNVYLNAVAISPDGSLVASGGRDKVIKIWDVKKYTLV